MKIAKLKKEKICEQILSYLFSVTPKSKFTSHIASELARDEEFVKDLLLNLKEKNLVVEVKKNTKGIEYIRRTRWKLSDGAYLAYKNHQIN